MKQSFLILAVIIIFSSCEDGFFGNDGKKAVEYMPLEIGNYWIYKTSHEIQDGTIISSFDTLRIQQDTTIGKHTYAILEGTKFGNHYKTILRHDSQYLINAQGQVLLDCETTGQSIMDTALVVNGDTIYSAYYNTGLLDEQMIIETPAGDFSDVLVHAGYYTIKNTSFDNPVYLPSYYAKNIGLVKDNSVWISNGQRFQMVLSEYGRN